MPCNSIITTTIDLSKASSDVMADTLVSMGFTLKVNTATRIEASKGINRVVWEKDKGTSITQSIGQNIDKDLGIAYSRTAIKKAASKNGWQWKQDRNNENIFQVSRR